jgi:plasmid stability protein
MPDLRIENVDAELVRELKIKAAKEGTSVRKIIIAAAEKAVGRKAGTK